jgi:hypothetical protein
MPGDIRGRTRSARCRHIWHTNDARMNKKEANVVWENKPFSPRRERESRQVRPRAIIRQANLSTICQQDANFEPIMCNLMSFSGYFDYASYYQIALPGSK